MNLSAFIASLPKIDGHYHLSAITREQRETAKGFLGEAKGCQLSVLEEVISTGTFPWQLRRAVVSLTGRAVMLASVPGAYFFGAPALTAAAAIIGAQILAERCRNRLTESSPVREGEKRADIGALPSSAAAVRPQADAQLLAVPSVKTLDKPRGIQNPRNNCWMNSALQLLRKDRSFRHWVEQDPSMSLFKDFFAIYEAMDEELPVPQAIKDWLLERMGRDRQPDAQRDAAEALTYVLGDIPPIYKSGEWQTRRLLSNEDVVIERINTLGDLPLPIQEEGQNVSYMINNMLEDGSHATVNRRGQQVEILGTQYSFSKSPPSLRVQLKRFNEERKKISTHVRFEESLTLHLAPEGEQRYQLNTVIVHIGQTMNSGHYVAYVREGNEWYLVNDSRVEQVPFEVVQRQQAYILHYLPTKQELIRL